MEREAAEICGFAGAARLVQRRLGRMVRDRIRALGHPMWVVALAVLVINDAYLKGTHPGLVTGKLSDVAGVVVLAWFLGAVTARPARSAVVIAVAFAVLKLVPGVAEAVAPLLGGVTLRDPTDVIAVLALVPSTVLLRRALGASASPEPIVAVLRVGVAVSAAVTTALAVGATSCRPEPGIHEVRTHAGVLWAEAPGAPRITEPPTSGTTTMSDGGEPTSPTTTTRRPRHEWARSDDGGRTWSWAVLPERAGESAELVCDPQLGCFRITEARSVVEHRPLGANRWAVSKSFTPEETDAIEDAGNGCGEDGLHLSEIVVVDGPTGREVVVAAGTQGVLQRSADGSWHRRAVFDVRPTSLSSGWPGLTIGVLALGLTMVLALALWAIRWRRRAARRRNSGPEGPIHSYGGGQPH